MSMKALYAVLGITLVTPAFAEDWPQFCGPDRNNISTETGLASSWPESGPKVLWETKVGEGYSSPAVKDGKVYFIDRNENQSLLRCMDLAEGTELWKCAVADPGTMSHAQFAGTRNTPSVTDDAVYFVSGWGTLVCVDLESKSVRWKHELLEDYGMDLHRWGMSQSPVVYKDLVVVTLTADDAGVVAYNRNSGELAWKSKPIGGYSFASPVVYSLCGEDMLIAVGSQAGGGRSRNAAPAAATANAPESGVFGLSLKDGSVLWSYGGWQCRNAIPFPTLVPGNRLFITGGYNAGSAMVRIEKTDEGYKSVELFTTDALGPQLHQAVYLDDHLLIINNDGSRGDGLMSAKLDGTMVWRTKDIQDAPTFGFGAFIVAGDKIVSLDADTGKLHLFKADVSGYQPLASAPIVKADDQAWAPLTLSDGKLLVRDWTTLKCVDLK